MASRAKNYPHKSSVLHVRIQPTTLSELKKAAAASGRTTSAEAEHQLHRALSDLGGGSASKTAAVMAMIAKSIDGFLDIKEKYGKPVRVKKWWDDPYLFDQSAQLVVAALEMLRPLGEPSPEGEPLGERSARFAIESVVREIRTADLSVPFREQKPYQRWLTLMRQDLGPLADRPAIWGRAADEERGLRALAKPVLDEYIPLSRKMAETPDKISPAEKRRLKELKHELAAVRETVGGKKS